jgi:hypothetical protein
MVYRKQQQRANALETSKQLPVVACFAEQQDRVYFIASNCVEQQL